MVAAAELSAFKAAAERESQTLSEWCRDAMRAAAGKRGIAAAVRESAESEGERAPQVIPQVPKAAAVLDDDWGASIIPVHEPAKTPEQQAEIDRWIAESEERVRLDRIAEAEAAERAARERSEREEQAYLESLRDRDDGIPVNPPRAGETQNAPTAY